MKPFKREFIEFCLQADVIRFGEFTLKSGRKSPYFFNAGLFNTGYAMAKLGKFYSEAIIESGMEFDLLFGPAYKGIPLAVATTIALAEHHNINKPFCFNRKTVKDHGEGGNLVGAQLKGKVLLIDDVVTAGTATREAVEIIKLHSAQLCGMVIALNRQEKGEGNTSAIDEIQKNHQIKVASIICLNDILCYTEHCSKLKPYARQIKAYQKQYGTGFV